MVTPLPLRESAERQFVTGTELPKYDRIVRTVVRSRTPEPGKAGWLTRKKTKLSPQPKLKPRKMQVQRHQRPFVS